MNIHADDRRERHGRSRRPHQDPIDEQKLRKSPRTGASRSKPERIPLIQSEGRKGRSFNLQTIEAIDRPLSGDNDYVRQWLVGADGTAKARNTKRSALGIETSRPSGLDGSSTNIRPRIGGILQEAQMENATGGARKRKKRHHSSSDSSIIESPSKPNTLPRRRDASSVVPDTKYSQQQRNPGNISHRREPRQHSVTPQVKKETFSKRPRHKTREDRYEPKQKDSNSQSAGNLERRQSKKARKCSHKMVASQSGENLIQSFSSKNIGQERLTIRPPNGLGLFVNGRASSPARRRGVPDLAFSEMDFLQDSNRQHRLSSEDKIRSKSRDKEKRKISRVQDETSTFFAPKREPLRAIEPNGERAFSNWTWPSNPGSVEQKLPENIQRFRRQSFSDEADEPPSFVSGKLGQDLEGLLNGKLVSRPRGRSLGSTARYSDMPTSYVSWSETQYSPAVPINQSRPDRLYRTEGTIGPNSDLIQQYIEETGVLRDTGINVRNVMTNDEKDSTMYEARHQSIEHDGGEISNSHALENASLSNADTPSTTNHHHPVLAEEEPNSNDVLKHKAINRDRCVSALPQTTIVNGSIRVQMYDEKLGWQDRPSSAAHHSESSLTVKAGASSGEISREEMAKNARIKRPSTVEPRTQSSTAPYNSMQKEFITSHAHKLQIHEESPQTIDEKPKDQGTNDKQDSPLHDQLPSQLLTNETSCIALPCSEINIQSTQHTDDLQNTTQALRQSSILSTEKVIPGQSTIARLGLPIRGSWTGEDATHTQRARSVLEERPLFVRQMLVSTKPASMVDYGVNTQTELLGPDTYDYEDLLGDEMDGNLDYDRPLYDSVQQEMHESTWNMLSNDGGLDDHPRVDAYQMEAEFFEHHGENSLHELETASVPYEQQAADTFDEIETGEAIVANNTLHLGARQHNYRMPQGISELQGFWRPYHSY